MTTPGNQIAPIGAKAALELISNRQYKKFLEGYRQELREIAPKHVNNETFVNLAVSAIKQDQKLAEAVCANPASLVSTLRYCAYLGHVPSKDSYVLVGFRDRSAPGGHAVTGIETYKGIIERMFRAGAVKSIHVEVGRENDPVLAFNRTRDELPRHEYDEFADPSVRGQLKVAYAWAVMDGGHTSTVAWIPRWRMMKHRAAAKTDKFWGPPSPQPEGPHTEDMWRKTALHSLEPYVPTSSAYRAEISRAETVEPLHQYAVIDPDDRVEEEIIDAEIVDPTSCEPGNG